MYNRYTLNIEPFRDEHLEQAARLLAQRQVHLRQTDPLLPARFEQETAARKALQAAWEQPHTSGTVALEGDQMLGYLIGSPTFDQQRGRSAWIQLAGHALAAQVGADLYRDLYAAAGGAWLKIGCFDHYILLPAADTAAREAWFSLSFGKEQAYALASLDNENVASIQRAARLKAATGLVVRQATPEDRLWLEETAPWIRRYQAGAPVWGAAMPEDEAEIRQGYGELLDNPEMIIWLAFMGGRVVGQQVYEPAQAGESELFTPEDCASLVVAATHPEMYRRGIQLALTAAGFTEAQQRGFKLLLTDWRTTNLSSSRFWPRQGFNPLVYRLVRRIDARISWAV